MTRQDSTPGRRPRKPPARPRRPRQAPRAEGAGSVFSFDDMGTPYGLDPVRSPTGGIMLYLYELPQRLPEGFVLVHNLRARTPQRRLGTMGFRVWLEPADTPVSKRHPCACGWASKLPPHYRVIRVSVPDSEREDPDAEGAR